MKFITSLFGTGSPKAMGRQYMKVGRNALFGVQTDQAEDICTEKVPKPLSLLISRKGKLRHGDEGVTKPALFTVHCRQTLGQLSRVPKRVLSESAP
ncbi:hypothetical protein EAI_11045 [Harpegnathos saltator]|uniref:Uncharacterized protein n=1 Tax=Harpegnathos saltator TaxID=610380 RepID=E2BWX5_HARSA|nr:hypothetical protein EAI_11045 [Harpegnathos saltator]